MKKIGIIFALVLVAFLVMGTASAGLFDFLGGNDASSDASANDSTDGFNFFNLISVEQEIF